MCCYAILRLLSLACCAILCSLCYLELVASLECAVAAALKLSPLNDWVGLYCVKRYSLPCPFYVKEHTRGSSIYNMAEGKGEKLIEGCFMRSKKVSNQLRQFDVTWGEFDRSTAVSPFSCHSQYQTSLVQNVTVGISGRGRIWVKETSLAGRNTQKPQ